jgi:CRISPR-associated protein Cmr6
MSEPNAQQTLAELLGTLEPKGVKGCVRLQMTKGSNCWGQRSDNLPPFYAWKGKLQLSAPSEILNKIILPVIRFAVMVGGVGRGSRRPLHIFNNDNGYSAARGAHLKLTHQVKSDTKSFGLPLNPEKWNEAYQNWLTAVRLKWPNRVNIGINNQQAWEIFSPTTCAVYVVPGPNYEPMDTTNIEWQETNPLDTRGDGMELIYRPTYKRKIDVGGNAAGGGNSHCSWVSIKRVNIPHGEEDTDCQEVVCLFMGGKTADPNHLRSRFLRELSNISGAVHLFGVKP